MQNYITLALQIDSSIAFKIFQRITNYPYEIYPPKTIKIQQYQCKKSQKQYLKQIISEFAITLIQSENIYFVDTQQKGQKMSRKNSAYTLSDTNILQTCLFQKMVGQLQKKNKSEYETITYKWGGYFIEIMQMNSQIFLLIITNQNGATLFKNVEVGDIKFRMKCIFEDIIDKLFNDNKAELYIQKYSKFVYEEIRKHLQIVSKTNDSLFDINFSLIKYAKILQMNKNIKNLTIQLQSQSFESIQPELEQMTI